MNPRRSLSVTLLLLAVTANAFAQSQPAPLQVYSDDFSGGSSAPDPGAQRGTQLAVDVDVLEELEDETTQLEQRLQAHLADTGAHQPHDHPHGHCPPGQHHASAFTPTLDGPLDPGPWKRSAAMALLSPPDSQSPRQLS